ncbi:hypothetical protein CEN50_04755 [Fischerella thermalis CCMEE 5268]|uniref:Uncharacterized protein n=1 Tax=Fischerella thermalis CCMEE 5268 TaxID=2019662 RepID=A0A2N6KK60_9CYAN|nr:hypothetical protein [Fischerella thermalis]PMB00052.1 hypothetical protein CEN50_04755 [Fischerella thermalis CCMEE 5268]
MNTKNSKNLFKSIATLVSIASVSAFFSLPAKAQVNSNPSIFEEYSHNRGNLAQTTPGVGEDNDNQPGTTTPGVTQPGTTTPDVNQPGTTTPGVTQPGTTTPGVTQPVQDTTTPETNQQDQDDNGVRALW